MTATKITELIECAKGKGVEASAAFTKLLTVAVKNDFTGKRVAKRMEQELHIKIGAAV